MLKVYRVLAYLVAAAVAFQAATIAYALFALGSWVENGWRARQGRHGGQRRGRR